MAEESKTPNADLIIALTDPFEKNVLTMQALFKGLHEEKHRIVTDGKPSKNLDEEKYWIAKKEKFLIDSLRDVLNPLGWDIVRRPPGARPRKSSVQKTLDKILKKKQSRRRSQRR